MSGDIFPIPKRKSKGISSSPGWSIVGGTERSVEHQHPATGPTLVHDHHRVDRVSGRPDPAQNGAKGAARRLRALHPQHNIMLRRGPPICCGRDGATPHVVTGHNNYRWGRKNPQRHHNVLHVENASPPASPIFLSTRGKVRARGQHPSLRRDRTLPSHRRGFWPPHSTILHYGQSP